VLNPPTIAPTCAAAERRHLGVWSACAAEGKCIAPHAHIVGLDLVCTRDQPCTSAVIDGSELFALPRACALSRVSVLQ
jgi:hypothetical protein